MLSVHYRMPSETVLQLGESFNDNDVGPKRTNKGREAVLRVNDPSISERYKTSRVKNLQYELLPAMNMPLEV